MKHVSYATANWSQGALTRGAGLIEFTLSTVRSLSAAFRAMRENTHLRHDLAQLDPSILRDLGVGPDEIARLQVSEAFTPRAWKD